MKKSFGVRKMTLMEKIKRIKTLHKDLIPEAIEDAERLKEIVTGQSPSFKKDGRTTKSSTNKIEQRLAEYVDAKEKIFILENELIDLRLSSVQDIDNIKNDKQRRFAKLYYVDGLTQAKIAQKTYYAKQTIKNNLCNVNKVPPGTKNTIEIP